jgi:ATP-dependent RNA helicase DDX60
MAPPEGSIFDPAKKWEEEKESRRQAKVEVDVQEKAAALTGEKQTKKGGSGKKGTEKKKTAAEKIKESNAAEKDQKDYQRDLMKLSNLKTLKALQDASCETTGGRIHRMLKMLHISSCDLKQGAVNASEAEVLDILWALEEMPSFKAAEEFINAEKAAKKEDKSSEKDKKKDSSKKKDPKKKDVKKDGKNEDVKIETKKVILTPEAQALKNLFKDGGDTRGTFKDSLKHARKIMSSKQDLISFQMTHMADRLPPLSRYNRKFQLEPWQCTILDSIDKRKSAVVCAPTSSGKTLLSTYTCKSASGTVLFVLPSEVLVWQIAATYYEFFKGNVTICTDQIIFQEITGEAQVYIGTPRALEKSISKVRGCAGQEMTKGEREFMILNGGYSQFKYLVLDEVHTLNGPEGDALQRIIKAVECPFLALSATIGNASQLRDWFSSVLETHVDAVVVDGKENPLIDAPKEVVLQEHFARFINLQRYVVSETEGKDGVIKTKLLKLHPVAAMTPSMLLNQPDLIAGLSMTPADMMDLWKRMRSIFPGTVLEDLDNPDNFFNQYLDETKRITLKLTKEYETRLKQRLTALSQSHPDLYERLRIAQLPPPLKSREDVSEILYDTIIQLKESELLPAVAFQLNTYGAFNMFKTLLQRLEHEQNEEFPNYRKDLIKVAREKAQMRKVAAGKASRENAAEAEEDAKSGFTDESLIQEDTTRPHDKYVLSAAGKRLGYNEVEDIMADMKKAGEKVDIDHALIRGLRRGMAIYTNEVGFSCYRRQVQMLAQKGRLAVVFSDSALAYGVNMPFRTCVFCGDMGEHLTPLIANQMQGRAGRRGMDVQGNVIYLGMEWSYIENLMLGAISHVTGVEPRYPTMALQRVLAASNDPEDSKHFTHLDPDGELTPFAVAIKRINRSQNCFPTIKERQMEWIAGTTLEEFCNGEENNEYLSISKKVIHGLGYVHSDMTLAMDHNVLTMVWELSENLPVAVNLCALIDQLYLRFCFNKTKVYKESDSTQNEFLSVLLHVLDRVPAKEGDESLQQVLRVCHSDDGKALNDDSRALWLETESILRDQQKLIDSLEIPESEKSKMQLIIPPSESEDDVGIPLDKGVYEMLVSKQKGFGDDQHLGRRNELKDRIVRLGQCCMIFHNNIQQPHGKYSALEVHFRRMFSNIKYSVTDMMNQLTDQPDLTEV